MDQWFVNIEFTPHSENSAASYIGCSLGTKCLDVITDLSTKFLKLFILSKIIIALHYENIESSEMKFGGNLWRRQVIEKYKNRLFLEIYACHSPKLG